jgi:hypothetical protein
LLKGASTFINNSRNDFFFYLVTFELNHHKMTVGAKKFHGSFRGSRS